MRGIVERERERKRNKECVIKRGKLKKEKEIK